jgi:hypothetical protein
MAASAAKYKPGQNRTRRSANQGAAGLDWKLEGSGASHEAARQDGIVD